MLPNFINLGAPRCGTSWLHNLLDSHPDIYVPQRRKEIHFFCNHYEKGIEWYEQFFPDDAEGDQYEAVGEVGVHYLMEHAVSAKRMAEAGFIDRLMVMLRDPVARAWSHYHWKTRFDRDPKPIQQKVQEAPMIIESGFYAKGLEEFERYFDREDILILRSEDSFRNVRKTKERIAQFLDVDGEGFPDNAGKEKVGIQKKPRYKRLYRAMNRMSYRLRMWNLGGLSNLAKSIGLKEVLMEDKEDEKKSMSEHEAQWLIENYEHTVNKLKNNFGVETRGWEENWYDI